MELNTRIDIALPE